MGIYVEFEMTNLNRIRNERVHSRTKQSMYNLHNHEIKSPSFCEYVELVCQTAVLGFCFTFVGVRMFKLNLRELREDKTMFGGACFMHFT